MRKILIGMMLEKLWIKNNISMNILIQKIINHYNSTSYSKKLVAILMASQIVFLGILIFLGLYFVNLTIDGQFDRRIQSLSLQFESAIKTAMISNDLGTLQSIGGQAILLPDVTTFKLYLSNVLVVNEVSSEYKTSEKVERKKEIYASGQKLGDLIYSVSLENVKSNKKNIYYILLFICLFEFLFAFILALIIGRHISRRTDYLIHGINQYANGDFSFQYEVSIKDEFGVVANSFNQMTKKMSELRVQNLQSSKMAALGEMAGNIAHEINNPLMIIIGLSSKARDELKKEKLELDKINISLERVTNTSKRIAKIINGLMMFSRNAEGDPLELVEFSKILEDSLSLCHSKISNKKVKLIVENNTKSGTSIMCRETQISQVIINSLNNALDAIENLEEPWVKLEAFCDNLKVFIMISDCGLGIPKEIANKMMEPFFTTKVVNKGTGLGLSISKGIIEGHHGRFYYDDNCKNTCFIIELPLKLPQ